MKTPTTRRALAAAALAAALAAPASGARAQDDDDASRQIRVTRLDNDDLAFMLLEGEPVYLPPVPPASGLRVRVWRAPIERSCGPAGHMICAYQYYLAVGGPGEGAEPAVYDLGAFGSVLTLRWAGAPSDDALTLRVSALNYPVAVFPRWPGLRREQRTARLQISADTVVLAPGR